MEKIYKIEVDCANCANKMEDAAKKISGVKDIRINFMTQKMNVVFEDGIDVQAVIGEVIKTCKKVDSDFEIHM